MKRVQIGYRAGMVLVFALIMGAGCTATQPATRSESSATQDANASATIGATMAVGNNLNHVPAFVGVEKGLFLENGLDLKLKVLNTGVEMNKSMQAGEAAFAG